MSLHKEISFEEEICAHLAAHGWLHEPSAAAHYDRPRAMFPADLVAWIQQTQPKSWEALGRSHGAGAEAALLDRVRKQVDDRGALDVIRHGVDMVGVKGRIALAQFRPAFGMNPDIIAAYQANRLRVVRQLRYSSANENCIDLALFLNGVPVATVELKTDFTQSVTDAIDQYRFDRLPQPKGQAREPLLSFPGGALVHFAVSNSEVHMTTKLAGPATRFLPFNKGDHGGAGNPTNPKGHRTSYLWEEVLERESWLEIIGRYLVAQRDSKRAITGLIFPRYHQLDATRQLASAVRAEGPGGKYLIQHSAGSGKTNSIAWAAHFLADLHDEADGKLFSTVIVVSDRNVIDAQLQDALFGFERTTGVVATIRSDDGAKSGQLAEALAQGKKIIVCTIQTFPFALDAVRELAATQGKRFAVIADEAHSSQTGTAAQKLKQVLSPQELADTRDGGEMSAEDVLAAQMAARAGETDVTYVAFTATPKAKTLELFGQRPHPDQPPGPANLPSAFHVYSMRQAIEEGFILDVLKNYTPYRLAFRLANGGEEWDEQEVERSAALRGIMRWVRLHPYNIAKKVEIVVEHFRENVQPLLEGKAKAMVVLASRVEAVRWKVAIDGYIKSKGYSLGTLVAFSGEVNDAESSEEPLTETSAALNPGLKGRDIREAFAGADYHLLLVANKFQTGFDQPLLCGMYVDRRLAGIQAVQTLSRLNRAHPGKDTTYVLDFVNSSEEILTAFRTYYDTAELESVTDPNIVLDLKAKLDASGHYDEFEVDRVAAVEMNPKSKQGDLIAAIEPVADRLLKRFKSAQERLLRARDREDNGDASEAKDEIDALLLFRSDMLTYQSAYNFLSQIFDYGNTSVEKRFMFYKRIVPLLEFGREREGVDLSKVVLTHHSLRNEGQRRLDISGREETKLTPMTGMGSGSVQEKERALLAEIIARVNDLFGGDTTDGDQLSYVTTLRDKMLESEALMTQAANNTKAQFDSSPTLRDELMNAIIDAFEAHASLSKQALDSQKVRDGLKEVLLGPAQLYEALRARTCDGDARD
ncbi:Type I site-specific restriction-modification system, R (restriction) subunit and related helicase [Methylobacterium indicum]|uniref:type I restriction endonuclease subunit R n=1 Tax=Methylobacterium indicum TaxID=1775910 RepID=UPI000733F1E0|nr:type I restriction endonuclease [Methylobacterium indicum]KTS30471.1 Type I site-specific restriction-modification system, R (restriction) subunit and related helicase [Methylobacterium indicum]KTS40035.1 Type I site-specific restriction-modification system, R (restriction) subunit and related helicase [Methylobacterium indicum]KTS53628.1 Type I site-specific restriction-modification system, R (restriction) subunit and related helicase [Methylobacterium indicum]